MKSFLFVFLGFFAFSLPSYGKDSITNFDLVDAWLKLRFKKCNVDVLDMIESPNRITIGKARTQYCSGVNLRDTSSEETAACLKQLSKNLEHFIKSPNGTVVRNCKENPNFKEFMSGNKEAAEVAEPAEQVHSVYISCEGRREDKYTWATIDGKGVCTKKYECKSKFRYGQSDILEPGTYYLRCNAGATSQADCDNLNLGSCEGKEVSYSNPRWDNLYSKDSIPTKATKAPTAQ